MMHLVGWLRKWLDRRAVALILSEYGFTAMFLIALVAAVRGLAFLPLMLLALLSGALTRQLAASRLNTVSTLLGIFSVGLVATFGVAARLFRPVSIFLLRYWALVSQQTAPGWLFRYPKMQQASEQIALQVNTFLASMAVWWQNLRAGTPIQLEQPTGFLWGLVVFGLLSWLSWFLHKSNHPILATVPVVVVMAATVNYTNNSLYYFAMMVAIGVMVWALFSHAARENNWNTLAYGYSDELWLDIGVTVSFVAIAVFGIVVLRPTISVEDIANKIEEWTRSEESEVEVGPDSDISEVRPNEGRAPLEGMLPNSHLLTDTPELLDQLLFQVQVKDARGERLSEGFYWRTRTFDTYTGSGWLVGEVVPQEYAAEEEIGETNAEPPQPTALQIDVQSDEARGVLIYAHRLVSVDQPVTILWRETPARKQDIFSGVIQAEAYTVRIAAPNPGNDPPRESNSGYEEWVSETYLQLPESLPGRVARLGEEIVRGYSAPYAMAQAIENFLRQYPYELGVPLPPADSDVVDHFLFELQRGYCDYYASAMVVLARSVGLPARIVVGYARGEFDPDGEIFFVTGQEAHSWVEIYLNGVGWVEFEPTAGRPPIERDAAREGFETSLLPPEPPPASSGLLNRLFSLPFISLMISFFVFVSLAVERLWFSAKSEVDLLMKIKVQIYQLAWQFDLSDPQTHTLREIYEGINDQINMKFRFTTFNRLGQRIQEILRQNTGLVIQVAYRGVSPYALEKKALVRNVISSRRALFMLKSLKFLWDRERA